MSHPELYVLRHGETLWNAENRMQGALDSPLTAQGIAHAERQHAILKTRDLTGFSFLTSPQGRAVQTAAIALEGIADWLRTDDRLREIGVGEWSGRLRSELPMPAGPNPIMKLYEMAPGGEGYAALKARCQGFLTDLKGPAVIVTHGVTGMVLRALVVGEKAYAGPSSQAGQGCVFHLRDGVQTVLE